jgi:hypothetical protein
MGFHCLGISYAILNEVVESIEYEADFYKQCTEGV